MCFEVNPRRRPLIQAKTSESVVETHSAAAEQSVVIMGVTNGIVNFFVLTQPEESKNRSCRHQSDGEGGEDACGTTFK